MVKSRTSVPSCLFHTGVRDSFSVWVAADSTDPPTSTTFHPTLPLASVFSTVCTVNSIGATSNCIPCAAPWLIASVNADRKPSIASAKSTHGSAITRRPSPATSLFDTPTPGPTDAQRDSRASTPGAWGGSQPHRGACRRHPVAGESGIGGPVCSGHSHAGRSATICRTQHRTLTQEQTPRRRRLHHPRTVTAVPHSCAAPPCQGTSPRWAACRLPTNDFPAGSLPNPCERWQRRTASSVRCR